GPHARRVADLAARARVDRAAFDPPASPPAPERALAYLRDGAGQAILVYVDAHVEGHDRFAPAEYDALERAMNDWLALYSRCHGEAIEPDATLRTAAELLLETRDLRDVARTLTHVPAD
ncbi:MAG: hypothetical protein ABEJ42_05710, partial [Halobacteriaceae archaeon]